MKVFQSMLIALSLSLGAVAQETPQLSAEEAAFQKVTQLAALSPSSAEFSQAWSDYVVNYVEHPGNVEAAIERVMKGANEFRRKFRAGHGGSGGPPLKYFEMRNLMQGIADEALGEEDG